MTVHVAVHIAVQSAVHDAVHSAVHAAQPMAAVALSVGSTVTTNRLELVWVPTPVLRNHVIYKVENR